MALTAIDIFSGAGGLTVGLKRAGFEVAVAVEIEPHSLATYKANHPEVRCLQQDIATVSGTALLELAGTDRIDLLAGCPPCQGFTSLTAKYRNRDDPRNLLVLEMARLAEEIHPRAIMMENVPGLTRKGESLYVRMKARLQALGYCLTEGVLQVADYGVPQFRRRFVLLAGQGFKIDFPVATHSDALADNLASWRTVRNAIRNMPEPLTLTEAKARGHVERSDWHVVRNLSSANVSRLESIKAGQPRMSIPEHLRPACHRDGYVGFSNVYGRMAWDRPSPTITGGCTTLSKGRFGHPVENRTISVREAALLQTFPRDYCLDTPLIDRVCNMIGNALPCDFAEALSRQCAEYLDEQPGTQWPLGSQVQRLPDHHSVI